MISVHGCGFTLGNVKRNQGMSKLIQRTASWNPDQQPRVLTNLKTQVSRHMFNQKGQTHSLYHHQQLEKTQADHLEKAKHYDNPDRT